MLYEKRTTHGWYVAPIVAGIDDTGSPYLATMDGLGATTDGDAWVSAGTASTYMLGPAQYLYKDGFTKEELLKTCTEVMQSSVNRDAFSGWGIKIYLIDKSGVSIYDVPCRMD